MTPRIPVFGRMRKDWEAMRLTCQSAVGLVLAVDFLAKAKGKRDEAFWREEIVRRMNRLRAHVCQIQHDRPQTAGEIAAVDEIVLVPLREHPATPSAPGPVEAGEAPADTGSAPGPGAIQPQATAQEPCPEAACAFKEKHGGAHLAKSWNFEDCLTCGYGAKRIGDPCASCAKSKETNP